MKVETSQVTKVVLKELDRLDPVTIVLENYEPGKGKIIIECYGQSWSSYWGGMSGDPVEEFCCRCDEHYLAKNLAPGLNSTKKDLDGLADHARDTICKERRALELTREEAREQFDLTERLECIDDLRDVDSEMQQIFGDEWWYCVPDIPNPDYEYLCRIIKAVQEGLKTVIDQRGE